MRHAIGAKIRGLRRPPEGARTGFGDGARRVAGADSGMRPPSHRHVAAVDGVQSAAGTAPKNAGCATRPDRKRSGGDAFAAPLPAVGLRPMCNFFRTVRRLGAWRQHTPSFSLSLRQKAQPAQFGGETDWPIIGPPWSDP
jgi:hypothetical protein